jgi:hypothetical protein
LLGLTACNAASSASDQRFTSTVAGPIVSTPTSPASDVAPSTTVVVSTPNPVGLPPLPDAVLADPMVVFQAGWICQSSQTAYATAADIDSALGVFLASSGVDRPVYDAFLVSLDADALKRAGVQYLYLQNCP